MKRGNGKGKEKKKKKKRGLSPIPEPVARPLPFPLDVVQFVLASCVCCVLTRNYSSQQLGVL